MKSLIFVCNRCGSETKDYRNETGWIHIGNEGILIAGGDGWRAGANMAFRYTSSIKTGGSDSLDFCSIKCFIEWLYTDEHTRNTRTTNCDIESRFFNDVVIPELMSLIERQPIQS